MQTKAPTHPLCQTDIQFEMPPDGFLLIGELGARVGMDPKTIRFYERVGLVAARKHGRIGLYNAMDLRRLATVKKLRQFGFSIETIRRIGQLQGDLAFTENPVAKVQEMMTEQLSVLEENRKFLDEQISDLQGCLVQYGKDVPPQNQADA